MFSPICQQSISTQVLGSREKSFYHALRWMVGQRQCWLACGSGKYILSCWSYSFSNGHVDVFCFSLPSTDWNFSLHTRQCCGAGEIIPHLLTISGYLPKGKLLPKKTSPCDLEMLCRTCLTDTSLCLTRNLWTYSCFVTLWADSGEARKQWGCPLQAAPASLPP